MPKRRDTTHVSEKYSEAEAKRRFEKALKGAAKAPAKKKAAKKPR